jgi:hypothetical protein
MSEQSQSNPTVDAEVTEGAELNEQVETPEVETEETEETAPEAQYSNVTPYAAAELANRILGVQEGDKPRTSQTFYSLARNGTIASNYKQWDADGGRKSGYKVEFEGGAFMEWLQATADGKIRGRSRNNYDKLAEEFAIEA